MAFESKLAPRRALARCYHAILASLLAASTPSVALAAEPGDVAIRAEVPEAGVLSAQADTPLRLIAQLEAGGAPASGLKVEWKLEPSADAILSHEESASSAGGADQPPAGEASTLFTPRSAGEFIVTARTQANPGCTGTDCARFASTQFRVSVAGAAAKSDGGGNGGWIAAAAGAAAAVAIIANSNSGDDDEREPIRTLNKISGDGQSAGAGSALSSPLVVSASDDGLPASSVSIQWSASGGATLSASSTSTNSSGQAQVSVTSVGPGPGSVTVTATRGDNGQSVSFSITVLQPSLALVSGNGQSAPISTSVPSPLVVEARLGSTPQSGVGITWAVVSGDASIGSVSNGGSTDGSGQSSATVDLGPTPGTVVVSATRNDAAAATVSFTINSLLLRTLAIVSGDNQTAAPNAALPSPLVVHAQDNGSDASGVTINWFATGGATLSSPTSVTGGSGQASITVTSTGPGPDPITVTAVRADDPSGQVIFNQNILPPNLSVSAGDGQSGLTGSVATAPLEVLLVDGASAPVSGQTINWTVMSGSAILDSGSSVTNGAGQATVGFTYGGTPGPITIQASAYSGSQVVSFNATAVTATGVNKTSGDNQSANPGVVLAPFVITIVPPGGVTDLSGVPVTFTVTSGTGSLSVTSTTTDALGQASTTLTLGLTPGTVTVVAQVTGGPSATFSALINGSLVATNLQIVSGDSQSLDTGVPSSPMVVELRDGGTPLPGQTLSWSSSNGTVSPTSSITDANGRASATVTPSAAGAVSVTVNFAAVAQYTASSVSFSHNTTLSSLPNLTTDEAAVAVALDSACSELSSESGLTSEEQDLLDQCEAMASASESDPSAVAEAIEEIIPDVAKTQTQTGEAAVDAQIDNLTGRMATLRSGVRGASLGGLTLSAPTGVVSLGSLAKALADGDPAKPEDSGFSRWGFFASGNIGRGRTDSIDGAPSYDIDIEGVTAGIDYRFSDSFVGGVALGYTKQDTTLSSDQGSVDLRGLSLSLYSTWYHESSWYVDSALSWANNDFEHRRRIEYTLPGQDVDQVARADSDGNDTSATITFGRDFQHENWTFGLYGRALYSRQSFDEFVEDLDGALAGSGLALRVESRSVDSLSSVLGGRASAAHSVSWGVIIPQFGLEWERDYSGDPDAFRAFLITDPTNTPILITGEALDDSYFRVHLGLVFLWTRGRSGFITYDRIFGRDDNTMQNLTLGFRMEF